MDACHFSHPKEIQGYPHQQARLWRQSFGTVKELLIMTNYLSKGSTVTGAYFANELHELREALKSKRVEATRKAKTRSASAA